MTENNENPGLFTSFKDIVQKVQKDVSTGVELMRLRGQQSGIRKKQENLFNEMGRKAFAAYKSKKDTQPIIKDISDQIIAFDKEIAKIEKSIKKLENITSPKEKTEPKESKPKTPAKKKTEEKPKEDKQE